MKITTWNVNGIRAREAQLLDWVARERPDVLCLQEIKASPDQVPPSLCSLDGYWCYWHGKGGYSGVGLHLRRDTVGGRPLFVHPPFDSENRVVAVELGDLVLASIYVPNGGKDYPAKVRFLEAMDAWVDEAHRAGKLLVLCGDMNVARLEIDVHPKLRKPTEIGQTPEERALIERILSRGLVDLHRRFLPDDDRLFTWWAPWRNLRERNIGWRIDYVFVSAPLAEGARSCISYREFGTSDHAPLTAELDLKVQKIAAGPELPPEPAATSQLTLPLE